MGAVVPRLWPGETFALLGCGPSLTQADVDLCRGQARVIAINHAHTLASWADVLYACDARFWNWQKGVPSFTGLKYALEADAAKWPGVHVLKNTGVEGLDLEPTGLKTGQNSGFQAINLAVHLGAVKILLLGYDMQGTHFFGNYPWAPQHPPFHSFLDRFATVVEPLKALGVEVINCTPHSMLRTFPKQLLTQALGISQEMAS